LIKKYLVEYSAVNKAPKSHIRDKSLAKHLSDYFENSPVLKIGSKDIVEYKNKRREEGAAPRTINYELTLMSHAFNIAIREWEWVRDNPVKKVSKEKVHNQIERWLTMGEEKRLLAAAPKWLKEIITFAIHTGFRESEILDLKWLQIDLARRTVIISEQKNKGIDTLPLDETVMQMLREKATHHNKRDEHVFPSENQTRFLNRNVFRAFNSAREKARIEDFRFHDLRHTFATRLVQNGVDLYTVQKLGRWKTTSMIMRYAHHYAESLRPGIEVMDKIQNESITISAQSQKQRGHKPRLQLVTPCF
jgi:integrase